uniref:Uncharacterized protein n=1 Tax=Syphacia muris TaxID=451379 RepID=A0A158R6A9_9BILA
MLIISISAIAAVTNSGHPALLNPKILYITVTFISDCPSNIRVEDATAATARALARALARAPTDVDDVLQD